MSISESEYKTLEDPPEDRASKPPDAEEVPGPINIISDDYGAATVEVLQSIMEEEGRVVEPEIAAAYEFGLGPFPGGAGPITLQSYEDDYPTHFDFRADVARLVNRIQAQFPWQTYANTYYMHPPVYGRKYEFVSVDFWGGGISGGQYVGYRGKPIGTSLGHKVWNALYFDKYLPDIHWIIWNGRMWVRDWGWDWAPAGPPDSDAGHYNHIHVTYMLVPVP